MIVVRLEGFEPPTLGSVDQQSLGVSMVPHQVLYGAFSLAPDRLPSLCQRFRFLSPMLTVIHGCTQTLATAVVASLGTVSNAYPNGRQRRHTDGTEGLVHDE